MLNLLFNGYFVFIDDQEARWEDDFEAWLSHQEETEDKQCKRIESMVVMMRSNEHETVACVPRRLSTYRSTPGWIDRTRLGAFLQANRVRCTDFIV